MQIGISSESKESYKSRYVKAGHNWLEPPMLPNHVTDDQFPPLPESNDTRMIESQSGNADDEEEHDDGSENDGDSMGDTDEDEDAQDGGSEGIGDCGGRTNACEGATLAGRDVLHEPDISTLKVRKDVVREVVNWGRLTGHKLVQNGGDNSKISIKCVKGRYAAKTIVREDATSRRSGKTAYALPGDVLCPFKCNVRQREDGSWEITKLHNEHNHPPATSAVTDYLHRVSDLTEEQVDFLKRAGETTLEPSDVLSMFQKMFPDAPTITKQDTANIIGSRNGGTGDAHQLLQILINKKAMDPEWIFHYILDDKNRLTHVFWMTPTQVRVLVACFA